MAGQLLAYVMAFGYRPFYGVYAQQEDRLLGLSPLTDQKLSGVVMMVEQASRSACFSSGTSRGERAPATGGEQTVEPDAVGQSST